MAKAKLTFQTPVGELLYCTTSGQGKLKYDPENKLDKNDDTSYQYTATRVLTEAQATEIKKVFQDFWKNNKPAGSTKQQYELVTPEMEPDLDKDGKEQKDDDDCVIKKPTGRFLLAAKTNTVWPDKKPNTIKIMRGNGAPLNLNGREIGEGSEGVIHGTISINAFKGNEGLQFYLTGVQLRKFVEKTTAEINAEDIGEDEGMDDLDMDTATEPINTPDV